LRGAFRDPLDLKASGRLGLAELRLLRSSVLIVI
jgi:hypothetical protein